MAWWTFDLVFRTAVDALQEHLGDRPARDPLTGPPNHRVFHERLAAEVARAVRHGRALSLALIDIDHFTLDNDAHGHQAGDRVLVEVAACLLDLARAEDMVGGEEFAVILPETHAMEAFTVGERARAAIAAAPHRPALEHSAAREELRRLSGAQVWGPRGARQPPTAGSPRRRRRRRGRCR